MDATKLKNQVRKFAEHLIVDKGFAKATVEGYCRSLSIALRRMRRFRPKPSDVKRHILWMHEKDYSFSHIVNTSLAIEHYAKQKGTDIKIGRPRKPRRIIKDTLSEAEVSRLIQAAANAREKALVCLLAYSGLRNSELCALKARDLDLGANRVSVLGGKNKKDGVVNISAECAKVLIDYLRDQPKQDDDRLFTTLARRHPLAPGDVRKLM